MFTKKAIGAIVTISLLLVVVVFSVIGFQIFFSTYSSTSYSSVEITSSLVSSSSQIETLVGDYLYVNNAEQDNLSILSIELDGVNCNISTNLSFGISNLSLDSCLSQVDEPRLDVVVYTSTDILEKSLYVGNSPSYITARLGGCSLGDVHLSNESSSLFYNTSSASSCYSQERSCLNGELNGSSSFTYSSCQVADGNFVLDSNGVTVLCEGASVGDTGILNGKVYTAVSNQNLIDKLNSNNLSFYEGACTSLTTNLSITHGTGVLSNMTINPNVSSWDVNSVTDMSGLFFSSSNFNQDLSYWDVSQVISMISMFSQASSFTSNISSWDVGEVIEADFMFAGAASFNSDISSWDVSSMREIYGMFEGATSFNSDLSMWDVSSVIGMDNLFLNAVNFNSDISSWNVSSVETMGFMFLQASSFNQNLSSWDVDQVTACMGFDISTPAWVLDKPNFTSCSP